MVDFKRAEKQKGQPARLGAGSLGLQDLPQVLSEAGFEHLESGEIPFPQVMGQISAGFVRAQTRL